MAISEKINSIKTHIGNAYTAIEEKGGMIPPNKNCENLKTAIESISAGSKLNIVYGANLPESSQIKEIKTLTATLPLPTAALGITNMGCAAVGTKVYLFGGYAAGRVNTIQEFDAETKTISTLSTTLPYAANSITCVAVGSKIYLFGGYNGNYLNKILEFDTISKTIVTLSTSLPNGMPSMGGAAVGTKIYLFGGIGSGSKSIQEFDAETKTITTLSETLPVALDAMGCASIGSKIYLFGGHSAGSYSMIQEFDAETKTITTLSATLVINSYAMGCASIGSKIYIFGGLATSGINAIQEFDTETKTIAMLSEVLPETSFNMGCAAVGSNVYLFGGGVNGGSTNAIREIDITVPNTSKLWIKSTKPDEITVSCNPEQQVEGFVDIDAVLPLALYTPTCSRVGDNIFIFGGRYSSGSSNVSSKNIYKFNISTKTISKLAVTLPAGIVGAISATIGTKIYIFETTAHRYVFDTETETISTLSVTPPTDFSNARCVSKDSSIFIFASSGDIYKYDANLNTFGRISKLPSSLYYPAVARVGAKIYVMGGSTDSSANYVDTIYEFDTDTLQTNLLSTTLPTPTRWGMAESIGSNIYFFGGRITTPSVVSSQKIYKFNIATKVIETLSVSLPVALYGSAHEVYGQQIFIFGGSAGTSINTIYNFVSSFVLTQNDILVLQDQTQNIFDLLSAPTRVQIGVKNVYKGNASNEAEFVDAYLFNGENAWGNVNTGDLVLAKYFAPTISLTGSTLTITPDSRNPSGVSYQIYNSLSPVAIVTDTTVDLAALITYVYGTHSISVKTIGTTSKDSNQSNAIDLKLYSITASLTNVTSASDNAERMAAGDTKTLTFTAAEGFEFPDTVEVSGATGVWTKSTGTLVLSNATGNITFTIAAMSASGHTVTISMREQGAYDTYANVYVDDGTSAVKYTASSPVTVKANSKIYIDAAADSFAVGWDGTFNATVTGGVTLTASTDSTATFAVTGDGTIVTNGITD